MPVVSIRFGSEPVHQRLKRSAARAGASVSSLAERLIDEGLRMQTHPRVLFRDGPAGRRAVLVSGPEVADVVASVLGSDVAPAEREARAAELLSVTVADVHAALAYYADFAEEIDAALARRREVAEEEEARWRRQRALLGT